MESLPDAALRLPCPQPLPDDALCLPCREMLPCLQLLPDSPLHRHFRWQLLPDAAAAAPAEHLPRSSFRTEATRGAVTSSAQTSASLHPPAALRLRVLPFTRAWTPTVCAEEFPTPLEASVCQIADAQTDANLSAHLHRLLTPPPYLRQMRLSPGRGRRCCVQDEAAAWPGGRCCVQDEAVAWPGAAFLQITARTNPCSRHLWGTLARAVASICAHRAR